MTAAAWHPDPTGRHELRYWDGSQWTEHVSDGGTVSVAPLTPPEEPGTHGQSGEQTGSSEPLAEAAAEDAGGAHGDPLSDPAYGSHGQAEETAPEIAPQEVASTSPSEAAPWEAATMVAPRAGQPPVDAPMSEAPPAEPPMAEAPMAETPMAQAPAAEQAPMAGSPYGAEPAAAPAVTGQLMGGAPMGGQPSFGSPPAGAHGISGDLISGRYAEVAAGPGPSLQNNRLLRVRIAEPFMARQGSMVAYQGNVSFAFQGGGAAKFLKKAFTGEGLSLMRVEGQGDVFLADAARHVHILQINNSGISVNGANVLAFSTSLEWNVERVKGGSIAAGGLFNTTLRGTGWVAITTDGEPVVLNAAEAPTFADANALVAWSVHLQTSIRSSVTAGALIGRGSGEAFQVSFHGPGFVIVQPSEGPVAPPAA